MFSSQKLAQFEKLAHFEGLWLFKFRSFLTHMKNIGCYEKKMKVFSMIEKFWEKLFLKKVRSTPKHN